MQQKKFSCSLVIAAYNCQFSIREVATEALDTLKKCKYLCDYKLIIVDDGSKDKTWEVLINLNNEFSNIKVIRLSKNFGQHPAMLAGLSECNSDLVAYCDDDGESPVGEIEKLIEDIINNNVDVVWSKYSKPFSLKISSLGKLLNELMLRLIYKKPKTLEIGNMWIAKRYVIDNIKLINTQYIHLGCMILSITTSMKNTNLKKRERKYGKSNYSFYKYINLFYHGLIFSINNRLNNVTKLALKITIIISILFVINISIIINNNIIDKSYTVYLLIFINCIQLLIIAKIYSYVTKIYLYLFKKQYYIIAEKND